MRTLLTLCMGLTAVLTFSQSAFAAFSFTLVPTGSTVLGAGGTVSLNVFATDNLAAPTGFFQVSAVNQLDVLNPFNAAITFSSFNPAGGAATTTGGQIGTIVASVSPTALVGHRDLQLEFVGVNGVFGGTLGSQGTILSNVIRISAVPEPSSLALVGLCGVGLLIRRKRKI